MPFPCRSQFNVVSFNTHTQIEKNGGMKTSGVGQIRREKKQYAGHLRLSFKKKIFNFKNHK